LSLLFISCESDVEITPVNGSFDDKNKIISNNLNPPNIDPIQDPINVYAASTDISIDIGDGGNDLDLDGDTITYSCTYDLVIDASVVSTTDCSSTLAGLNFSTTTGVLDWSPDGSQSGSYEFKIVASDGKLTDEDIFTVTVNPALGQASAPMVSTWRTTSPSETITLPLRSGFTYNFTVDWGDGSPIDNVTTDTDSNRIHTYAVAGDYTVTITGMAQAWYFNNSGDKDKLISVNNLGDLGWTNLEAAFRGCLNLESFFGGTTISVTNMSNMFRGASNLSHIIIPSFDTTAVTSMAWMFDSVIVEDLDLSNFNTSATLNMSGMFYNTTSMTNVDLSSFNTSAVTNMSYMFQGASALTSLDLSSFNTSVVTDMSVMFYDVNSLETLDLSNFNTAAVTTMSGMFWKASGLTSLNISNFNTSIVANMMWMFREVSSLTSLNLSHFDTSAAATMVQMFDGASGLTVLNLMNWNTTSPPTSTNIFLNMTGTILCNDPDTGGVAAPGTGTIFTVPCTGPLIVEGIKDLTTPSTLPINFDVNTIDTGITYSCSFDNVINGAVDTGNVCTTLTGVVFDSAAGSFSWPVPLVGEYEFKITADDTNIIDNNIFSMKVILPGQAGAPMLSTWRTTAPAESITLPLRSTYNYNFTVDWGDGTAIDTVTSDVDVDKTHTYALAGDYTVTITGNAQAWYFNNVGSKDNLISIIDLGDLGWTDLKGAFYGCTNLISFSGGVTSDVLDLTQMFAGASSLTSIDVSSFDTSNVTDMRSMFSSVSLLTSLDLSSFNTSSVTQMSHMFYGTSLLASLDLSSFTTPALNTMNYMFYGASLFNENISGWDTSSVWDMANMFQGASTFNQPLNTWNTENVTKMVNMFAYATSFDQPLASWDVSKVVGTDCGSSCSDNSGLFGIFTGATSFNQDLNSWNVSNAINLSSIFRAASSFNNGMPVGTSSNPLTWTTTSAVGMASMFFGASSFNQPLPNFNTSLVNSFANMFNDADSFNQDISSWNTSSVERLVGMFKDNDAFNKPVLSWNTSTVADMDAMFYGATAITSLDLSSFDTSSVTKMEDMFRSTPSLVSLNLTNWDTSSTPTSTNWVTNMSGTIYCNDPDNGGIGFYGTGTVNTAACNSLQTDTDSDGITDFMETILGFNPAVNETDTDGDGIPDAFDTDVTGAGSTDTDGDGISDELEAYLASISNQYANDFDNDGITDIDDSKPFNPANKFISIWRVADAGYGDGDATITLPLRSGYTYNFNVDWGDGTSDTITSWNQTEATHDYGVGISTDYTVTISGQAEAFYFNNTGDKDKIISITNFGELGWLDLTYAFFGCTNLEDFAGGNTSSVTTMEGMFRNADALSDLDMSSFDTLNVLDMTDMFAGAFTSFHPGADFTPLDTQNVTSMSGMFASTSISNLDLSSFDTTSITDMSAMFFAATATTLDVSNWDTSGSITSTSIFTSFTGNIYCNDPDNGGVGGAGTGTLFSSSCN
jgi:surface protein